MTLRRVTRQTQKSSKAQPCIIESYALGYATVRLGSANGSRLTNVPVLGGVVTPGNRAIVDYSTGNPVIRPLSTVETEPEGLSLSANAVPLSGTAAQNMNCFVYGTAKTHLTRDEPTRIRFTTAKWDIGEFFQDNGDVLLPRNGLYMVIAHLAVKGFPSNDLPIAWDDYDLQFETQASPVLAYLSSTIGGIFASATGYSIDTDPIRQTIIQVQGFLLGIEGEKVLFDALYSPYSSARPLDILKYDELYPRLMIHRMNLNEEIEDKLFYDPGNESSQPGPGYVPDPADISIQNNQGFLRVIDELRSHARAMANVTATSNMELTLDYQFSSIDYGAVFRIFLRASNDWDTWNTPTQGYELAIENTGAIALHRITGGTRILLDNTSQGPSVLPHKLRFRCNNSNIKVKIWLGTDSEPGPLGWLFEVNDTGGFTTAGHMQLGYFRELGEHELTIDNVSVHTPV